MAEISPFAGGSCLKEHHLQGMQNLSAGLCGDKKKVAYRLKM